MFAIFGILSILSLIFLPEIVAWPSFFKTFRLPAIVATAQITLPLFLIIYGLCNHFSLAWFITILLVIPLPIINHLKYIALKKPIEMADIILAKQGAEVLYPNFQLWHLFIVILIIVPSIIITGRFIKNNFPRFQIRRKLFRIILLVASLSSIMLFIYQIFRCVRLCILGRSKYRKTKTKRILYTYDKRYTYTLE